MTPAVQFAATALLPLANRRFLQTGARLGGTWKMSYEYDIHNFNPDPLAAEVDMGLLWRF